MKIIISSVFLISLLSHNAMGAILPIMKIGNPILRAEAKELTHEEILSPRIQKLITDMGHTMTAATGVGLAAPQVNESIRLFVMKKGFFSPLTVVINPKIEYLEAEGQKMSSEGCLSIPGKQYRVERYKKIHLSYFDRKGEFHSKEINGFEAIISQHEYDHLNGVLIVDLIQELFSEMNFTGMSQAPLM